MVGMVTEHNQKEKCEITGFISSTNLIERIFNEAQQLGMSEEGILADFTAGPRSMILGLLKA